MTREDMTPEQQEAFKRLLREVLEQGVVRIRSDIREAMSAIDRADWDYATGCLIHATEGAILINTSLKSEVI